MTILRFHRALVLLVAALTLLMSGFALAADPSIQSVSLSERGRDLILSADVALTLNSQLEDAAERGLPLYFTAEVEITRPRWYWFDETVLTATQTWRIIRNPLTRQWRVSAGVLALPVGSLSEALSVVQHVRTWRIAERDALKPGAQYSGRLRVRFDVSQLSKPFQVTALNSSEWSLSTPWTDFPIVIARDGSPASSFASPPPTAPPTPPPSPPAQPGGTGLTLPGDPDNSGNPGVGLRPDGAETP